MLGGKRSIDVWPVRFLLRSDFFPLSTRAFLPEVIYEKEFLPVCGAETGAAKDGAFAGMNKETLTSFCTKLGFERGRVWPHGKRAKKMLSKNAMMIGSCKSGEALNKCSLGRRNGLAYPRIGYVSDAGFKSVSDQCHAGCAVHVTA